MPQEELPPRSRATEMSGPQQKQEEPSGVRACSATSRQGSCNWLPLATLVAIGCVVFAMGWHDLLTIKSIGLNYQLLHSFIATHLPVAIALYFVAYVAVVALSLPCALALTLAGGLLFGSKIATPVTVLAATIGATIIFLVARSSLGTVMASRVGPWLARLREGFSENALSYLLFLRLVPAFPFVVVNLAAAVLGVPLRTYVLGTFLGIIPGTTAITVAGAGLGSVIKAQNRSHHACLATQPVNPDVACPYRIDTSALLTKELILAFVLLGIVALIPVVLKKWRARDAAA